MVIKEEEFHNKLLSMFKIEAKEHVCAITSGLIELEKSTPETQTEIIETIFREAHSLKGAVRSVNFKEIESLCQYMENVFAALKRNDIGISPQLFDTLHLAVDYAGKIISGEIELTVSEKAQIKMHIQRLGNIVKGAGSILPRPDPKTSDEKVPDRKIEKQQPSSTTETIRISTAKLDTILLCVEQLLAVKLASQQSAEELRQINESFEVWKKEWAKVHGSLNKQKSFLEWNQMFIKSLNIKLNALSKSAQYDNRQLGGMVDELLDDMKKVLMLPFSSIMAIFPKLVRDLSRDQGKEVDLIIEGEDIEIDRRILEELKDPLIHLIRNCIDHGIETPGERKLKNKQPGGQVKIMLSSKGGNKIEILVSDDGAGINASLIRSASIKSGIISMEEAGKLREEEVFSLIFKSGVSTSPIITEVSGRGLGLAIVHEKVEKLNGTISFEPKPDAGTTFKIVIPHSLATLRGLLVRIGERQFILPAASVERVITVKKENIKTVENRETICIEQSVISMVSLCSVLELAGKENSTNNETIDVVVLALAEKRMAFMVDEVLYEQEVLMKSLGRQLLRVPNIGGATILGSGRVVLILNVHDLMKSAVIFAGSPVSEPSKQVKDEKKSILVVEDSITSRTLLKNIFESAMYDVTTAFDGIDALAALENREFDLVVSDIDMPRLNGFDLTAKIRSDKRLCELPVVLVTSLDSREDKERGIDVGANAYIVKGSFDRNNLLEVIQKLI